MKISIIAALTTDGVIGWNGKMPWKMETDLRRFRELTKDNYVVMGRRTFESIGKPLPNRTNIVVTRNPSYAYDGVIVVPSVDDAISMAFNDKQDEVFIIGGTEIFRLGLKYATHMYLTRIHAYTFGDTYFPPVNWDEWICTEQRSYPPDQQNDYPFTFETYQLKAE